MDQELKPSKEWRNDQMVFNLGIVFSRYYSSREGRHLSKGEIIENLKNLGENERLDIVYSTIKKEQYPAPEIQKNQLLEYINSYLSSNA